MTLMLRSRMLRWHTFRVVLLTSLVWILVGFCVLVYYMDCLGNNGINCVGGNHRKLFEGTATAAERLVADHNEVEVSTAHGIFAPYSAEVLKTWQPAVSFAYRRYIGTTFLPRLYICYEIGVLTEAFTEPATNPSHWPGEGGHAVTIPKEEETLKNEKFKLNQFNILASDKIALNRSLNDVRMESCKDKSFPSKLPTTSIVIVFHNEAWSTLLRTVHSIIRMSPNSLIAEIILVDDASERDYLGKQLEDYVSQLPVTVKVLRTGVRSGLIRARLLGASHVTGQVITFLDAHCECTKGWLEPLLARIVEDRTRVVCPIIDVISDETFQYITASDMTWGGFNWRLNFRWYRVPQRELDRRNNDRSLPVRTPTMAGGLFSIDRDYFEYLGKYDEGMEIWGGENLELSFRIWMCGGSLEIVTCSHVGHVFRKSTPYTFPGGTSKVVNHNNGRLAEVWLDEWKDFYYAINPSAKRAEKGDTSQRKQLRKDLHCKSFKWYLTNIYPESQMPLDYYSLGEIRNSNNNYCLDTFGRKSGENAALSVCHGQGGNQVFAYTKRKQIMADDNCLDASDGKKPILLLRCHGRGGNQEWDYNSHDKTIIHVNTGLCLDLPDSRKDSTLPTLKECDGRSSQRWKMISNFKWQASDHENNKDEANES